MINKLSDKDEPTIVNNVCRHTYMFGKDYQTKIDIVLQGNLIDKELSDKDSPKIRTKSDRQRRSENFSQQTAKDRNRQRRSTNYCIQTKDGQA